jgi:putative DNA primase/helicase
MTAEAIAIALNGRRSGDTWMACCVAHEDRSPSLAIREKNGVPVVHCHAGCSQKDVIAALASRGLWTFSLGSWRQWHSGIRYPSDWGTPSEEYRYKDSEGRHTYSVVRFVPKTFRQGYRDDQGRWLWRRHPDQVLYRMPEVLRAQIVFVTEGEKDAEILRDYGFCATTNAGGANAPWLPRYTETLAAREVIIVPDNDEPGWMRARTVAAALLGRAADVIILDDIHRTGARDVSDWFAQGHSECELIRMLEGVYGRQDQQ